MTASTQLPALPSRKRITPLSETTTCPDPQAAYQRLRERHGPVAPVELEPGINAWLVMDWKLIHDITHKPPLFSRNPRNWRAWQEQTVAPDSGLGPMMFPRDNAYFYDGTQHLRLRAPLDHGIARIDTRRMRLSVQAQCTELISWFAARGTADLVAEYAAVIPMLAVAALFGLDTTDGLELQRALVALFGSGEDSQAGNRRFEEILVGAMTARQQQLNRGLTAAFAPDDLTAAFLRHPNLRGADGQVNAAEVAQSMVLMISAGYETTMTWIAATLLLMLTDARFRGRMTGGRMTVDDALDQVLWRDPPMANMPARYAMAGAPLAGQQIRRGDALILGLSAANNHPQIRAVNPWEEFGNHGHLAWSTGPHACPARVPARIITRTAVETALQLLPSMHLTIPAGQVQRHPSPWTRCPMSLPVTFSRPPRIP